jgi:hypothetical protein
MKTRVIRFAATLFLLALQSTLMAETPPDALVVIDLRPQEEREGNGLLPLVGKCNKNVFRIADVASDPLKGELLRAALAEQMGLASDGKTLTVLNWSIYYNKTAPRGGSGGISSVGVGGYSIPTGKKKEKQQGSKCSREESTGGWYEAGDVSSPYPPLVSEFAGTYGGKEFNIRVVYSPRRKIDGKFEGSAADTEALLAAVSKTAEALATAVVQ